MSHRRAHRKSRLGCCECKRRHIKCDEGRPSCRNCAASGHACNYQVPAKRATRPATASSPRTHLSPSTTDTSNATPSAAGPSPSTGFRAPDASTQSTFAATFGGAANSELFSDAQHNVLNPSLNMRHMELLSHFITVTGPSCAEGRPFDPEYVRISISAALLTPCLMYEILALSALHLSQLRVNQAEMYREEALALQTQALSHFNENRTNITVENCSSILLFSSFLGLHALADAVLALETNADGFLDMFVNSLKLNRGVRTITTQAWSLLQHSNVASILNRAATFLADGSSSQLHERATYLSDHLHKLLASANMSTEYKTVCRNTVDQLRLIYQFEAWPGEPYLVEHQQQPAASALIWTWPATLSARFTDLLMQRKPEALIILCHYAVLLHHRRHLWFVGHAGRTLIEGITSFLGTYWRDWLVWPNEVLDNTT